jgi:DNA-directed RNA polymerase subunit beta
MVANKPQRNRAGRINLGLHRDEVKFPNLIEAQQNSFDWFLKSGFQKLFAEISPVKDTMERMWTLHFKEFRYDKVHRTVEEAAKKGLSYEAPLYATIQLLNNKTGEIKQQEVFVADVPMMTFDGSFVINGVRRVVVHQIVRAEGVLFEHFDSTPTRDIYAARLMPETGQWCMFEVSKHNVISTRLVLNRPRVLLTELLRVFGYETDDEIRELFKDVDTDEENKYIEATLARDFTRSKEEAINTVYNKLRPDETVTLESAEKFIKSIFFNERKFNLGRVGRYQLNRKLGTTYALDGDECRLYVDDLILIIKKLIRINNGVEESDDIDHLSNRRIRSVGEVLVDQLRPSIRRLEKNIRDKMSMYGEDAKLTPSMLVGTKPISASIQSFFGSNQLSAFMDQKNILGELENKRKITAAGPGGLIKERATFSVREVHQSQYSRFDPVTSPEGHSIGVVNQLAVFAKINEFGFIEAPYKKVLQTAKNAPKFSVNRIANENIKDGKDIVVKEGELISEEKAARLAKIKDLKEIPVRSYITEEIVYLDAKEEDDFGISVSTVETDEHCNVLEEIVPVKYKGNFVIQDVQKMDYVDVIPAQQAGVGMGLIPFVEHNDAMRALTGSNMQRQGVPLVKQQSPVVGTGFESIVAEQSGWAIFAKEDGVVEYVDGKKLIVKYKESGIQDYEIIKYYRSNEDTSFSQYPRVLKGDKFKKGDLLVDGPSMVDGELSIGTNLNAALMFYEGFNYEDAVVISDRVVKDDLLTSVHISQLVVEVRDTELGPEVITGDIPNVNDRILSKLDERGIVRIGSKVIAGDILVGVVAPRGEKELTAEEKLLRAIFGESASEVRDNSLRVPHGTSGIVINTQILSSEKNDKLGPAVLHQVKVWIAETKKINYGDKISGRHGDKNTVAAIRPIEDMPFTADGEPVDIVLTPTFIKRMNMGQAIEVHYGLYASLLGEKFAIPAFEKSDGSEWIKQELEKLGFTMDQKTELYDGRTGEKFPRKVTVGLKYTLKLHHVASEKVHARSTGPYTLVTQQPLGGRSKLGGQRFGEMEVWALEGHGAPYTLQEMLTIKSDDVSGRADAYKAIISGEKIEIRNVPESFKVLIRELNALCLNIDLISHSKQEEGYEEEGNATL